VVPLMVHQDALTGSPFHSTYTPADTALPALRVAMGNLEYYLWGEGSSHIALLAAGVVTFFVWLISLKGPRPSRQRIVRLAALVLWWVVPTTYFVLHPIPTPYYQLPTLLVVLAAIAGIVVAERQEPPADRSILSVFAAGITAAIGVYAAAFPPPTAAGGNQVMPDVSLPAPLQDERAWIIGDRLVGTLWYYHGIVAHRIGALDPAMQRAMCHFVLDRGEPLYMMVDNPAMYDFARQVLSEGVQLKEIGTFANRPDAAKKSPFVTVYQVFWPK
jgi:hypothetical protein